MTCPYCSFSGHRMDLHAHLVEDHAEEVKIYVDQALGKMVYELTCPLCQEGVKTPLSKRAEQLQEYQREIRMVAFDLLLYHLEEMHPEGDSGLLQIE
ncbi:MAG: hypothetical protein D6743_00690 [Calditrichaeota bacterium]|nr:MAG: hypothetical protein D6743_00690 [Calditrichota bacterium]